MTLPWIVVAARGVLVCLPPLAAYLSLVAGRYRRNRPTVVGGVAEFLTLLGGLAGFALVFGLLLLTLVQSDPRLLARGPFARMPAVFGLERVGWTVAAFGYALALGGLVARGLKTRNGTISVTNADPAALDRLVTEVLAATGVPAERFGDVWASERELVAVEPNPSFAHATVRVLTTDIRLREELLRRFGAALPNLPPAPESMRGGAAWLSLGAKLAGGAGLAAFGLLAYFEFLRLG